MTKKSVKFYYIQNNLTEGPFLLSQIRNLIQNGIIRADAKIKNDEGDDGDIDEFLEVYGWTEGDDEDNRLKNEKMLSGTKFVINKLNVISALIVISWIIIGGIIGLVIGSKDSDGFGTLIVAIIGLICGGVVGYFSTVFFDWTKQMLVLQNEILEMARKNKK